MAQCLGITGLVTILWWICGFSLAFAPGSAFLGHMDYAWFKGVTGAVGGVSPPWVSLDVFAMFQLTFAIITPALIVGAIAERMKFKAILIFIAIWMFIVYFPLAHMVWGSTGLMNGAFNADAKIKAIDFAGGTVVHMSSGWSALILCLILGKRIGFGKDNMAPHSVVLCMVGTAMLWVVRVGDGRMAHQGQAQRGWFLLRCRRRLGCYHTRLRLGQHQRSDDHRRARRLDSLLRGHLAQADLQV
jgi:Amt family ammonium transporter